MPGDRLCTPTDVTPAVQNKHLLLQSCKALGASLSTLQQGTDIRNQKHERH